MTPPVLLDFEARSRVNLASNPGDPGVGGRHYWADERTDALCCVWRDTRDGAEGIWFPGERWPHPGRVLAAHNMRGFDRHGCERYGFRAAGYIDTAAQARKAGLPGSLDALGQRWLGIPKDEAGSAFTKALSGVRRPIKATAHRSPAGRVFTPEEWKALPPQEKRDVGVQPELTPEAIETVCEYCYSDVGIMAQAWPRLEPWLEVDADVEAVDATINDRGIRFDVELASRLWELDEQIGERACAEAARQLGWTVERVRAVANSPEQFTAATGAPNAQAGTVELVDHPLARARESLASIARGKLLAGLTLVHPDGRLRDMLGYYRAHTGRWGGQGFQPQNLTRPAKWLEEVDVDEIAARVLDGEPLARIARRIDGAPRGLEAERALVSFLLRPLLCASPGKRLVSADLAAIEARGSAWLAGDFNALDVHVSGMHPYKVAATHVYGVSYEQVTKDQRQVGKAAELACGYQGGAGAFANIARLNRIDLTGVNTGDVVKAWRRAHAPIVRMWYALDRAFKRAIEGHATRLCPNPSVAIEVVPGDNGRDVAIFLPSGRPIVYPNASFDGTERRGAIFEGAGEDDLKAAPFCDQCWLPLGKTKYCECGLPLKGANCVEHGRAEALRACPNHGLVVPVWRARTYGGKLFENVVQALCRDFLAGSLVTAERDGLPVVLHVHDEPVCEVDADAAPDALAHLNTILTTPPDWAADFPLGSDGWHGERYRK